MENITKTDFIKDIVKNIDSIEMGLEVIDTEILIQKTNLSILCVDSIGRLIIVEAVQGEDDTLMFRALDHFDWILHNMEVLKKKYKSFSIDHTLAPEIILISNMFSASFKQRISYLNKAKIHLYEYSYKNIREGESSDIIDFVPVKFKKFIPEEEKNKTAEQLIKVINSIQLKNKCRKCIEYIMQLKQSIKIDTSKSIIQFNDENGYFAGIYPFEDFFWINFNPDYWNGKKISKDTTLDFNKIIT